MAEESPRELRDKRLAHLKSERALMDPLWRELRDNFAPHRGRFDKDEGDQRKRVRLPNGKPLSAVRTLASGLHAGLTSPARPWQRSAIQDDDLAEYGPVKEWLATVDQRMMSWYARSNLYQALPFIYAEYGTFGTMAMLCLEDDDTLFRFEPFTVGQYYLARDGKGRFDTLYREFTITVRQMVKRFGLHRLSRETQAKWTTGSGREHKIDILHVIEPGRSGWDSCYYESRAKDGPEGGLLKRASFAENPILGASWEYVWGETYASSCPGMVARGDAIALQVDERDKARAIQRHHNPPMQGPSTLKNSGISLLPGAMNWVDQQQSEKGGIRPVHDFTPNIQGLLDNIARGEQRIDAAFYVDLFLMLTLDERNQRATAEEIRAKYDEKVLALGPTLEQANAMLRALHARCFGIMVRRSKPIWEGVLDGDPILPPPPRELEGMEIEPEFISALQQAQRAQTLQGLERYAMAAGNIAALTGAPPEKFDVDQYMDELAAGLGVPPGIVRDDEEVAAMREAAAQQQQMEQAAAMAPALKQGADALKAAGETVPQEGSVLQALGGAL